jgi:hypothetical protein
MSPPGRESRPDDVTSAAAPAEVLPGDLRALAVYVRPGSTYPGRSRVLARRRVKRILDLELAVGNPYPDVVELYCRPVEAAFDQLAVSA